MLEECAALLLRGSQEGEDQQPHAASVEHTHRGAWGGQAPDPRRSLFFLCMARLGNTRGSAKYGQQAAPEGLRRRASQTWAAPSVTGRRRSEALAAVRRRAAQASTFTDCHAGSPGRHGHVRLVQPQRHAPAQPGRPPGATPLPRCGQAPQDTAPEERHAMHAACMPAPGCAGLPAPQLLPAHRLRRPADAQQLPVNIAGTRRRAVTQAWGACAGVGEACAQSRRAWAWCSGGRGNTWSPACAWTPPSRRSQPGGAARCSPAGAACRCGCATATLLQAALRAAQSEACAVSYSALAAGAGLGTAADEARAAWLPRSAAWRLCQGVPLPAARACGAAKLRLRMTSASPVLPGSRVSGLVRLQSGGSGPQALHDRRAVLVGAPAEQHEHDHARVVRPAQLAARPLRAQPAVARAQGRGRRGLRPRCKRPASAPMCSPAPHHLHSIIGAGQLQLCRAGLSCSRVHVRPPFSRNAAVHCRQAGAGAGQLARRCCRCGG